MTPAVSVLLPVRDAEPFLAECIASLERQTRTDFEVVAVDDGSGDGSGERLEAWARRDARVRVLRRPPRGIVAALNAGLAECRAPLVARMDGDDVAHPRRLELQAELLRRRPETGVASCLVRHFPWRGVAGGFRRYEAWLNELVEPGEIARERFVESPVAHPSITVRRELLEAVGGYRERGWPEDHDLVLRLLQRGVVFAKVPRILHFWRERGDRLSRRDPRYGRDRFLACKAHHLVAGPLATKPAVVFWGAGPTGRRLARLLEQDGVRAAAFVDVDPRLAGRTVRGARVVTPEQLPGLLTAGSVVLAAVAALGAREQIRAELVRLGLVEGAGFWCVA